MHFKFSNHDLPPGLVEVVGWLEPVTQLAVISSWQTKSAKLAGTKQVTGQAS